jgi:photosystem II stability/assembly factor-like uncharacterized protein
MRRGWAGRTSYGASALLLIAALASVAFAQTDGWVATRRGMAGKDLNAVFFADSKRGWIGGDGGFLSYTRDGGRTWAAQTVGTSDAINDIYFRSKEDGYLLAGSRIFTTRDGGESWRALQRFAPKDFGGAVPELYSIRFADKKKGWVVGSLSRRDNVVDSLIFYTDDGGASWQRQKPPTREELIHVDFTSDERGWVVGASGTILSTTDAGASWTPQRSSVITTLYHVDFRNKDDGLAVGERGTILRTVDGGQTWSMVFTPARNTLLSVQFVSEDEVWIIGRGGTILYSEDGGRTWARREVNTKENLYALFMEKKRGWVVGGDGVVLQYEK